MEHSVGAVDPRHLSPSYPPGPDIDVAMAKIEALSLFLSSYVTYDGWLRDLTALLRSFPSLSRLRLALSELGADNDVIIRQDPDDVNGVDYIVVPMLRQLELSRVSGNGNQLAKLLRRHRHSLRNVILHKVRIDGEPQWPELLTILHKSLPLCSFRMIECLSGEDWIYPEYISMAREEEFAAGIALLS